MNKITRNFIRKYIKENTDFRNINEDTMFINEVIELLKYIGEEMILEGTHSKDKQLEHIKKIARELKHI
jgi:hypothetical protein